MSHSSLHQPVVTSAPCASPAKTATATFPTRIPNICYANAPIRSFFSKLKTTSSLEFSLASYQKCAPTSATRSPYSPYPACVSSPPVKTLSIWSQKNSDRAAWVPPSFLPSSIVVSSVNSLNHLMQRELNPCLLKQQNHWFRNLCRLLRPQSTLTLLLAEQFLMVQFLIQQISHSLVLHLCILFLILSKWQISIF